MKLLAYLFELVTFLLVLGCSTGGQLQESSYRELYSMEFTSIQIDSICEADNIIPLQKWDSLCIKSKPTLYYYADSTKVYRAYKIQGKYNVTKRVIQ